MAFVAGKSVTAPLTWGQFAIWKPLQWFGDATASFNLHRSFAVPEGVTDERFADCVRILVERHSSLRTHFVAGEQHIAHAGEMLVGLYPQDGSTPADQAADVAGALAARSFDLTAEWPVRFAGVVSPDGRIVAAAVAASHVALDGWAINALADDLHQLVSAGQGAEPAPDTCWEPLDQLAFEQSEAGKQLAESALAFWAGGLSAALPSMFDFAPVPADGPPIHRYRLVSKAFALAAPVLSARSRTSISTVLLTLTALWLARYSGHDAAVLQLIVGNRFDRRQRALRAPAAQNGLFVLPVVPDTDLVTAMRRAFPAAVKGYLHGRYHVDQLDAVKADVGLTRGVRFDLSAYFNDMRRDPDWAPPRTLPDAAELARLRAESTFTQMGSLPRHDMKFMMGLNTVGADRCALVLLADGRYLPPPAGERLLRGLELIACAALHSEVVVADVDRLVGVAPVTRDADWVQTRAGWVRPAAVRRLVGDVAFGGPVAVHPRSGTETPFAELVAYVAVDRVATGDPVAALHRRVVAALPEDPGVAAPDEYVLCQGPVHSDASVAEWKSLPVLGRGAGRL